MELKEHLLHYVLGGHIHLSKKDYAFFNNLQHLIKDTNKVTSNQSKLFDKLIVKYQRQLKKNGFIYENLIKLPWKATVVESKQEFLDAKIFIENNQICIKSPFNNNFISSLRKEQLHVFTWDKNNKVYRASITTYSLKQAINLVTKFYKSVKFCPQIQSVLDSLQCYNNTFWDPVYVKKNNTYYIGSVNQVLFDQIADIKLDNSPKTLYELSKLGIKIHSDITENDEFLIFSSQNNSSVEIEDLYKLVHWLRQLEIDFIWLARDLVYNKAINKEIIEIIDNKILYGSTVPPDAKNIVKLSLTSNLSYRDMVNGVSCKTVLIRNSRPVKVT